MHPITWMNQPVLIVSLKGPLCKHCYVEMSNPGIRTYGRERIKDGESGKANDNIYGIFEKNTKIKELMFWYTRKE